VASGKTGTINADINYGGAGSSGNILTLTGGGKLVLAGNTLLVANDGGAKSAYFSVEGGSELDVTGTLATMILNSSNRGSSGNTYMGGSSGNNILKVTGSSGRLVTGNFNIGSAGNDGNQVYISAPGTYSATTSLPTTVSWTLYGNSAQLNMKSSNNLVQIDSGAFVLQTSGGGSAGWIIGSAAGNNGNKLIVTGLGTTLSRSSSGYVQVGAVGSNNGYEIKAGGLVVGGRIEAGQGNGTDATNNNYYLVTGTSDGTPSGTPSYFRVNGAANGHFALGEKANTDGNSFRVEAGARADLFGTGTGKNFGIGFVSGANNNYIKVTGVGSTFNLIMGQELTVGGNQSGIGGSGNHVDVFDGGSLIMNNTDNTIPLAAPVSWTTWAAPPTTSTAMNLTGATSSLNIGNGTGNTALVKIGSVNGRTGVQLTNASSTLNFSNGRLRMVGVSGTLVSGIGTVNLNGPAYFDTNNTNSIDSVIDGTVVGTLIKEGGGTLTLSQVNTYLGDTRVDAGTLSISNAYLADAAAVRMLTGGVLNLTTGTTDTIGALYFDNVLQATGTWGALSSGAQHESAFITGTGRLDVVPEPATMAFVLLGGVGLLARRRRRA
ncbi:MAG: autotransporter-associated beta strand repeat-containing protein, partial [Planctomycetota bacterium]|nr:autotransporter-associated beta strand repeat-containing protein [Planctomycetota bacterium]